MWNAAGGGGGAPPPRPPPPRPPGAPPARSPTPWAPPPPRATLLEPRQSLKHDLSIMAACPGTKMLVATVSHGDSNAVLAREFHRVVVT